MLFSGGASFLIFGVCLIHFVLNTFSPNLASDFFLSCFLETFFNVVHEEVGTAFFLCPSSGFLIAVTCFSGGESGGLAIGKGTLMKLSETSIEDSSMVVMISQSRNGFGLDTKGLLSTVIWGNIESVK